MSTEPPPRSSKSLKPSSAFSIFRKPSLQDGDLRPSSRGALTPKPTTSTTESDESRSTRSSQSRRSSSIRDLVTRLRSSSNVTLVEGPKLEESDFKKIDSWWNGFEGYSQLVTLETSLDDAYAGARFAAICGILSKIAGNSSFFHGLPERAIDLALLWCPAGPTTRRKDSEEPSWSWTGWEGQVNFPFDPSNCPDLRRLPRSEGELFRSEISEFRVGPPESQYCLRREQDTAMRSTYATHFHAPYGKEPNADTNTLRFSAFTINADSGFDVEQMENHDDRQLACSSLLVNKNTCGILMDFEERLFKPHYAGEYEFVLISRNRYHEASKQPNAPTIPTYHPPGTPIWNGERFLWLQQIWEHDEVYPEGPWKMLNVMLIRWHGDYAERVAVGKIHEDEWQKHKPTRRNIVLK
ncbi:hypothetical protein EJ04DRAFT_519355 [Polyplosphaeria fusca]|uniref:Uncharacterized protein n=1 Tax=Polyplosphaeria fusca TaxID=682080 RepID=A0A9P4RA73_9PLEO|nr:hypothetical protein EJ04DRAFT_519355 [Polyplosphaeria fusca]